MLYFFEYMHFIYMGIGFESHQVENISFDLKKAFNEILQKW